MDRVELEEDEQLDVVDALSAGDDEVEPDKPASSTQSYFPSSMGLSVLVPYDLEQIEVTASWGDYAPQQLASETNKKRKKNAH